MSIVDKVQAREEQPRFHRDVRLVLDAAAFARAQDLNHQLEQAVLGDRDDEDVTVPGMQTLADELDVLHDEHPPVLFRFEARTPDEWTDLVADHDGKQLWHHVFAQSCVIFEDEPVDEDDLTAELVARYAATLTPGQWSSLVGALRSLNEALFDLRPTSAAYAALRRMRPNSTSATDV